MKVRINRRKWKTGTHGQGKSALRTDTGMQCCLGFVCKALGATNRQILFKIMPDRLFTTFENGELLMNLQMAGLVTRRLWNSNATRRAAESNDDCYITHEERESEVKKILGRLGFEIEFYGKYGETVSGL